MLVRWYSSELQGAQGGLACLCCPIGQNCVSLQSDRHHFLVIVADRGLDWVLKQVSILLLDIAPQMFCTFELTEKDACFHSCVWIDRKAPHWHRIALFISSNLSIRYMLQHYLTAVTLHAGQSVIRNVGMTIPAHKLACYRRGTLRRSGGSM